MSWEKNLEQGEWFETNVTRPWLLKNRSNWWITDSRNHIRLGGKGPRLVKGKEELVLPDFRLDNPETGESGWLDSKLKNRPFSIAKYRGEKFYSIDPHSYMRYRLLMSIFKHMKFEILLGCAYTNIIWLLDLSNNQPIMHEFQNKFVRNNLSATPCFSTSMMIMSGRWNSNLLPK